MVTINVAAGETEAIDIPLEYLPAQGTAWLSFPGTGTTVTLELYSRSNVQIDTTGKVTWLDAAAGIVRYLPGANDLPAAGSPYSGRFAVTAGGRVKKFPEGLPDQWVVRR